MFQNYYVPNLPNDSSMPLSRLPGWGSEQGSVPRPCSQPVREREREREREKKNIYISTLVYDRERDRNYTHTQQQKKYT